MKKMKSLLALLLCLTMLTGLVAGLGATALAEEEEAEEEQLYSIVSPLGKNDVEQIKMAPRLDTLAGKKIALVGGSFHASTTHNELRRMIQQDYPDAQIFMFDQVGSAGTYNLFAVSAQVRHFQEKLQQLGIDAVITGNCG